MRVYDSSGRPVTLGREIARGGEGAIIEVANAPQLVAKIYHSALDPEQRDKLVMMTRIANADLMRVAAWPTDTLYDSPHGTAVGITLPKVESHRQIHELYSSVQRKLHFPKADWSFLLHVAMNCAAAFETVHERGHVIGDVNQSGVLVSINGTVRLIDCDSFQIRENGRIFFCVVGVPQYTPPELQGSSSFRGVVRTESHDCFGLALLIFHLLFMGRHPYAGRFRGHGDMPIEQAITEGRFAFGRDSTAVQMSPPPHALALDALPPSFSAMFERAFAPVAKLASVSRPKARDWRQAIITAKPSIVRCATDPSHAYFSHCGSCPWCRIEHGGGPAFFVSLVASIEFDVTFDLQKAWNEILAVKEPPPAGALVLPPSPHGLTAAPVPPHLKWVLLVQPVRTPCEPILDCEIAPELPDFIPEVVPNARPFVGESLPQEPSPTSVASWRQFEGV